MLHIFQSPATDRFSAVFALTVNVTLQTNNFPGQNYLQSEISQVDRTATSTTVPFEQFTNKADVRLRGRAFSIKVDCATEGVRWRLGSPRNSQYLTDLVRALEIFLRQAQNPQLNFQNIPTDANNNLLQQGDMYIADGGFLKIAGKTEVFSGSVSATGSVGTVTVSVS